MSRYSPKPPNAKANYMDEPVPAATDVGPRVQKFCTTVALPETVAPPPKKTEAHEEDSYSLSLESPVEIGKVCYSLSYWFSLDDVSNTVFSR